MGEAGSRRGDTEASDAGAASGAEEGRIRRPCLSSEEPAEAPVAEWLVWGQMCWGAAPSRGPDLFSQTSPRVCLLWA